MGRHFQKTKNGLFGVLCSGNDVTHVKHKAHEKIRFAVSFSRFQSGLRFLLQQDHHKSQSN
jgi:hypothetical protein